ncbi:methyltransferase [Nocardioides marmoraquaticus]
MTTDRVAGGVDEQVIEFAGLSIAWDPRVLRPRPWTELQSRWAAELLDGAPGGPVLELCSGAGHIGLAAAALSGRDLVCVDVDDEAVRRTTQNARANGLADRVEVRHRRLQDALGDDDVFALVIADPPWVTRAEVGTFPEDPVLAIDGGDDGLGLARDCVATAHGHLAAGGSLLLQLGSREQAGLVGDWAEDLGWTLAAVRDGEGGVVTRLLHP